MTLLDRDQRLVIINNNDEYKSTDYDWNYDWSSVSFSTLVRNACLFFNNMWYDLDSEVHGFKTHYYGVGILNQ